MSTILGACVTPVTPYLLRVSQLRAFIYAACDTVTAVTAVFRTRTHTRAHARARAVWVSQVSQVEHSNNINELGCDTLQK